MRSWCARGALVVRGCAGCRSARPPARAESRSLGARVVFSVFSPCVRGAFVVRSWCVRGAWLRWLSVGPSSGAGGVAESRSARGVLGVLAVRSWCARGARLRGLSVCPSSRSFRSFGPPDLSALSSWSVCSVSALVGVRKVISSVGPPLRGRSRAAGRLFDVAPACSWSARSASAVGGVRKVISSAGPPRDRARVWLVDCSTSRLRAAGRPAPRSGAGVGRYRRFC